eukprot:scaffold6280_cov97-Isochrysis_galbana.AAC.2
MAVGLGFVAGVLLSGGRGRIPPTSRGVGEMPERSSASLALLPPPATSAPAPVPAPVPAPATPPAVTLPPSTTL